jgi:hypothetical protein
MKHKTTVDGKTLESFDLGFYSDGESIYVDLSEFLEGHGMRDTHQARLIVWSEIKDIFRGLQLRELSAHESASLRRERALIQGAASRCGPIFKN